MPDADVNQTFDKMLATGVRAVRLMIPRAGVEQVQGQSNWTNVDRTVGRPASAAQDAEFAVAVADR